MVKGCALCHAAGLAGRWLNHAKTHGHCGIHGEDSWFCFTETRSSHSPVDRICSICILTCALNSKFTVQTVGPKLSTLGFDDCSFVPEPNTTAFCYLRLLLQAGCSASVKPLWPTFLEKLCRNKTGEYAALWPRDRGAFFLGYDSVCRYARYAGTQILMCFGDISCMMISCIPQYIMCIIALYIYYI